MLELTGIIAEVVTALETLVVFVDKVVEGGRMIGGPAGLVKLPAVLAAMARSRFL